MKITNLKCEYLKTPLGIDVVNPRFSWEMQAESGESNIYQQAYEIRVYSKGVAGELTDVWNSGKVVTDQSVHVIYDGSQLENTTRYFWQVKVWSQSGADLNWSELSWFETAFLNKKDLTAKWIESTLPKMTKEKKSNLILDLLTKSQKSIPVEERLTPVSCFRKEFIIKSDIMQARIYATAHGIYRLEINGKRIGNRELAPEFTSYGKMLLYQTYDVTDVLKPGNNALGAYVADGWYGGRIGLTGDNLQFGDTHGLYLQMELIYENGEKEIIVTDESFKCASGAIVYSDLFIGEKYDARREKRGWNMPEYNDFDWKPVDVAAYGTDNFMAQKEEPVTEIATFPVQKVIITPEGDTVIDLGQNIAGRIRMKVNGKSGDIIKLEHTEMLDEHGNFMKTVSGKNKDQTDIYVCKGDGEEIYEPYFTFHGFRYVRINGYPGEINLQNFTAVVISSLHEKSGEFSCSNEMINKLQENTLWSQRSNFLSIPTDCPQRERAGWTGDIAVFSPTGSFNYNINPFLSRWLKNMALEQMADGQIPYLIPYLATYKESLSSLLRTDSSTGWSDACIFVPYTLYEKYGDIRILEDMYPSMKKWVEYAISQAETKTPISHIIRGKNHKENEKYLWNTGFHFGDWLAPSISGEGTIGEVMSAFRSKAIIAPAYFAYELMTMTKVANILGKTEDSVKYNILYKKVQKAFSEEYISATGRMKPDIQGAYVVALQFNLVSDTKKQKVIDRLVTLIHENGDKLDTGFLSVPYLLDVLYDNGHQDLAYHLLYQEESPGWMYEIKNGATTIWESWKAVEPNGKVTTISYNHYAMGCVCDFVNRKIGGLHELEAGYKKILIKPVPDPSITHAHISHHSIYGLIKVDWEMVDNNMKLTAVIPCNTKAIIELPNGEKHKVGSGTYTFI